MKLTKTKLKQIIKEELEKVLEEEYEEGEDPYPEVTRRIKATPTTKQKKEKEEAKKKRAKAGKSTQADLGYSDERMRDLDSWK